MSKGDIARAIMYMCIVYKLKYLTIAEIMVLRQWSLSDPPNPVETEYNKWVQERDGISNPFISKPGEYEQKGNNDNNNYNIDKFTSLFKVISSSNWMSIIWSNYFLIQGNEWARPRE